MEQCLQAKELSIKRTCDSCTKKKVRCDGLLPSCSRCVISSKRKAMPVECIYSAKQRPGRRKVKQGNLTKLSGKHIMCKSLIAYASPRCSPSHLRDLLHFMNHASLMEMSCIQALLDLKTRKSELKNQKNVSLDGKVCSFYFEDCALYPTSTPQKQY